MVRTLGQIGLFGLLLALVTTLPNKDDWNIYSFHINSTVSSRYATTIITSRVANRMEEAREIEFHVRIPKNAFITKFRMFIDGEAYDGIVKAKEAAKKQYDQAVSRGQSAGIVSSVGRTLEEFKTSVNVAAHKKVTFELTYEELLKRTLGKYELQIHARPMQPVKDFKIDVHIKEKSGINFMEIKGGLSTQALANALTKTVADTQAWVYFYPTEDQQKTCDSCGDDGMNGDLVLVYDVNRDDSVGEIETSSGYFVHHFAPSNLPRIPKNVVFIIDQSGSMHGRKMQQTRIALLHILNDLAEEDFFGVISFDSSIFHWKRELVQATGENIDSAKQFARKIQDRGSTDINLAVLEGARMLNANPREGSASILILLTDGDPTSGETNTEKIQSNVREAVAGKFPLYCLGFGFDVNFGFLEKMSLQNSGVARRIYEDSDADQQLKGFYEEVATPLLTDVTMVYVDGFNLTQTDFSQYYNGSEIVVAGQIFNNDIETFAVKVVALSRNKKVVFTNGTVDRAESLQERRIQRVWAYLTVKQLLDKELRLSGPEKENAKKEALELSLKYSFVTPLTSMVVTKPPGETTEVLHKPKEGEQPSSDNTRMLSRYQPDHGSPYAVGAGSFPQGGSPPILAGMFPSMSEYADYDIEMSAPAVEMEDLMDFDYDEPNQPLPTYSVTQGPTIAPISPRSGSPRTTYHSAAPIIPGLGSRQGIAYNRHQLKPILVKRVGPPPTPPSLRDVYGHLFLLKAEGQSLPLCYDIIGSQGLKILRHPSKELSVNGQLDSGGLQFGFNKIVIHVAGMEITVEVQTIMTITVKDGENSTVLTRKDEPTTLSGASLIWRDGEIEFSTDDLRLIVLNYTKNGRMFLWPVLRQMPTDPSVSGLLALKAAVYEEVPQNPTKLMINNKQVDAVRHKAVDYSITDLPTLDCWRVAADAVLQNLLEFYTNQLSSTD